jgi:hypothetical protein
VIPTPDALVVNPLNLLFDPLGATRLARLTHFVRLTRFARLARIAAARLAR